MEDEVQQFQSLSTDQDIPDSSSGFISPQQATFLATVVPLAVFGIIAGLMINRIISQQNRHLADFVGGLKVALIVGSIPIGISLLATQTGLVTKAERNPTPRNVRVSQVDERSVEVNWRTGSKVSEGYRLSENPDMNPVVQTITNLEEEKLSHSYTLTQLEQGKVYYMELFSDGFWYGNGDSPIEIVVEEGFDKLPE